MQVGTTNYLGTTCLCTRRVVEHTQQTSGATLVIGLLVRRLLVRDP